MSKEKIDWKFTTKRQECLLDASLMLASNCRELKQFVGSPYSESLGISTAGQISYYTPEKEIEKQIKYLLNNWEKTQRIVRGLNHYYTPTKLALNNLLKELHKNNYKPSAFNKFFKTYRIFIAYRIITRIIGYQEDIPKRFMKETAQHRLNFINQWNELRDNLEKVWEMVAEKFNTSSNIIKFLTYQEFIINLKRKNFRSSIQKYYKRKNFILHAKKGKVCLLTNAQAKILKRDINKNKQTTNLNEIHGRIACPGKVRGIVKIILDPTKVKISKKFILVTSMTTPNFIPLLKWVKAIVTDEGGLTCHAAIISRELNIPCIIGTQISTTKLNNDDRVEVDADTGIIKKLK